MNRDFWLSKWNKGETGFHQDEINSYLKKYWPELGLEKGVNFFVPLCGKSRDMLWLVQEGHSVLGVEFSPMACEAFFTENKLAFEKKESKDYDLYCSDNVAIRCGDFFDLKAEDLKEVKGVYDRASLIALPPDMRERYSNHLKQHLPKGVPILLLTLSYPQGEMNGPPFPVTPDEVEKLYSDEYEIKEVLSREIIDEEPLFQSRGLTSLVERVFVLKPM